MAGRKIDHVGIMVKDIEKSINFYTNIVGFKLIDKIDHSNGVIKLAFLGFGEHGETELELIQGYNDSLPVEGKVHHLAVAVDDVNKEFARIQSLEDVKLIDEDITTLPNGFRYFFFHGPEGEWIEYFQR
ncbi:VOC family protein [Bacillus sp. FJAT-27245]|uniref:VOC family protein n=1 Tax=Bacillus sp. FJAT-27245 TaxID=1684144 RepID=UPI0006A7DE06|nr:VOC family protein [Bacillus sp. FJAT-27245]